MYAALTKTQKKSKPQSKLLSNAPILQLNQIAIHYKSINNFNLHDPHSLKTAISKYAIGRKSFCGNTRHQNGQKENHDITMSQANLLYIQFRKASRKVAEVVSKQKSFPVVSSLLDQYV